MNKTYIMLVTLFVLILIYILSFEKKESNIAPAINSDGKYCFVYKQEAIKEAPYQVEEHVKLNISGEKVTGSKTGTQNGPDMTNGYFGDISGTKKGNNIEVVFSFTIEGSNNKELEVYEFSTSTLTKLRWSLVEKDNMLVPNRVDEPRSIEYIAEPCN